MTFDVIDKPYRARTKDQLRYLELKTVIDLIVNQGKTVPEIKTLSKEENLLNAPSIARGKEIINTVCNRVSVLDEEYMRYFLNQSVENQKLLALIAIMVEDHTFYDFMDLVIREKIDKADYVLRDSDIVRFVHELQDRDEAAAKWTDVTIRRFRINWKGVLRDSGMLEDVDKESIIEKPLISDDFADFLEKEGIGRIKKILLGER